MSTPGPGLLNRVMGAAYAGPNPRVVGEYPRVSAGYMGGRAPLLLPLLGMITPPIPAEKLQLAIARRVRGGAMEGVGEGVEVGVRLGVRLALGLPPGVYCPRMYTSSTRRVLTLHV